MVSYYAQYTHFVVDMYGVQLRDRVQTQHSKGPRLNPQEHQTPKTYYTHGLILFVVFRTHRGYKDTCPEGKCMCMCVGGSYTTSSTLEHKKELY